MERFESETVEFKEKINDTLVKEVVAFLNTSGGSVYIGVSDDGTIVGVDKIDESMKKISDIVTDQIEPSASDCVEGHLRYEEGKTIIELKIEKGRVPLYYIKKYGTSSAGCFIRLGTTCRSMTLEHIQRRFRQLALGSDPLIHTVGTAGTLSFGMMKNMYLQKGYHIEDATFEENFRLRTTGGYYNKMAELLADENSCSLVVAQFQGKDKSSISNRNNFGRMCILASHERVRARLEGINVCRVDTSVRPRREQYLFDIDAVNEAVVNALVHNDWDIATPLISIFSDRIEIFSHGGLPYGQTKERFFMGISNPRNQQLMRIFTDLDIAEETGHGIPRIVRTYGEKAFDITDDYIQVTIPFAWVEETSHEDRAREKVPHYFTDRTYAKIPEKELKKEVLILLERSPEYRAKDLSEEIGTSLRTIERTVAALRDEGLIRREGSRIKGRWIVQKELP